MFLGKPHAASDLYSPLFGPTMGFKTNGYNTRLPPTDLDARRFGEKPFLIYTSWLLNRRFGERKRKGHVHFGHSMSRRVTGEAIRSFPRPALQSTCQRFRGETGFQLYSWYVAFHYTIERQREALLWSYIMQRADANDDGMLDWAERQTIMAEIAEGAAREAEGIVRERLFFQIGDRLEAAGLEAPRVNVDALWTSLDGPAAIRDVDCSDFDLDDCLAPGFTTPDSDARHRNPVFASASVLDRAARQQPKCGDCLLPDAKRRPDARATVIKALLKYQYTLVEPDALFVMVTDAVQVRNVLLKRLVKQRRAVGQLCLNDDVAAADNGTLSDLMVTMRAVFETLVPEPSVFERATAEMPKAEV
jgi:hypothetical protein